LYCRERTLRKNVHSSNLKEVTRTEVAEAVEVAHNTHPLKNRTYRETRVELGPGRTTHKEITEVEAGLQSQRRDNWTFRPWSRTLRDSSSRTVTITVRMTWTTVTTANATMTSEDTVVGAETRATKTMTDAVTTSETTGLKTTNGGKTTNLSQNPQRTITIITVDSTHQPKITTTITKTEIEALVKSSNRRSRRTAMPLTLLLSKWRPV